jgi:hypothetical protein
MKITTEGRWGIRLGLNGFLMLFALGVPNWTAAQVIVPVNGTAPTLTPVTINSSAGDQFDPHVSGDWAAYTSDTGIRYYNFATNTDAAVPLGPSADDLLSDVSGSKIAFARVIVGVKTSVMVFDAATPAIAPVEVDPAASTKRIGAAIGGNTVAYVDFSLQANGELVVSDLNTLVSTRITNDTVIDGNPSVSPDGNVVVWERCASSLTNCDIWQAVKTGGVWNASVVADTASAEANPETNGTLVVYDSHRGTNPDIFWRSVAGGTETQLQMPGWEGNPSMAGNYIAFESRASQFDLADILVYDLVANKLYQITNTPLVNEQLNDITVLPDGRLRVVWTSDEDGADQRNVKAATFSVAHSTCGTTLGVLLPAAPTETITQGGAPNFADTYVTPYVASQSGNITSWKAEFTGGDLLGGHGVPSGIQLKVLRHDSANILQVINSGAVHDPRPALQARFGVSYPSFFASTDSILEFTDSGLNVQPGDIIGLTIRSDPAVGGYFYPLISSGVSRLVLRDVTTSGTIDLDDPFTGTQSQAPALEVNTVCSLDTTPPVLDPIANVVITLPPNSTATSMPVTFPLPTATDDRGTVTVTTNPVSGATFPIGTTTVNVTATDGSGNTATGSFTVTVQYGFAGFFQPVDNLPTLNVITAGQAVPVKFSLSGNKGLSIFTAGYPTSGGVGCDANDPGAPIEETVTAGGSSLSYTAASDQYSYVWKTDKAWKGTCRILDVRLKDGTNHFAKFRFK